MKLDVRDPRKSWAVSMLLGVDWARTPAGPEEAWPQSLRTALDICFDSRFPIIIFWGRELVQFYNEAYSTILGAKHPRAFGQRAADCFPEIWDQIEPMLGGVLETGTPTWSEDLMLPLERNGFAEECYFTFSYSPLSDENGIGGVFCAVAETTAKVLREREACERADALAELDRAKTDFFNNISHEFRTPLTLILGPLDDALAGRRALDAGQIEILRRNAQRLLRLVNTLLEFSRIDANRASLARRAVDLPALTAEVASTFRSAFESAGIGFEIDAPPLEAPVAVDPRLWEHLVLNLLSNALKFSFRGTVRVALRKSGALLRLEVADEGAGLSEAERARAFERFWRGSGRAARTHEGSGIGLALVAQIAELHGGSARLEGAEGVGTTAIVEIPYEPAKALDAVAPALDGGAPALDGFATALDGFATANGSAELILAETSAWSSRPLPPSESVAGADCPSILLVEDNADLRDYITRLLAPAYRVLHAADGAAALAAAIETPPALILSDVMMPGMDGIELVRRLRSERRTRGIPILLLSARADEGSTNEGLKAGADDYMVKPFASGELLSRIQRHIDAARIRAEEAARFRQLADEIPEMIWTHGPGGELDWINKRWFEYTGLSRSVGSGDVRLDLVAHADDLANFRRLRESHVPRGEAFEAEVRLKPANSDGSGYRWHLARLVPVRDPSSSIVRWIGTATDIHTGRTLAEERERDLKALAEAIPQMVWTATPDGRNDYFNSRWAEYIGEAWHEGGNGGFERIHPADRAQAVDAWRRSLELGEPYNVEIRMQAADGTYHWFVVRAVPQRDESGVILRWFGTSTDIDDLKQAQEALAAGERRYRTLIETTTEGIWVIDADDRTTFVNARMADLLGSSEAELIGRTPWEFVRPSELAQAQTLKSSILAGESGGHEFRLVRRDGREIWVHVSASVLHAEDGAFRGVLGMVHDITQRKRAETEQQILAAASEALAQALGLRQTLDRLLAVVVPALATWASIDLKDEDQQRAGDPARTAAFLHVDARKTLAAQALLGRSYVRLETPDEVARAPRASVDEAWLRTVVRDDWQGLFAEFGTGSAAVVPLFLQGRTLGWITFVSCEQSYANNDLSLLNEIATRAAVAIEHARLYDRERRVAVTLQDAALPKKLPVVPGLTFSAVYQAGRSEAQVGGDWYDAFRLGDGRIIVSIGDVMGSGLDAAVTMGAVRQVIRGAAQIYAEPVAVLNAADRALRSEQPDRIVTAFVGLIDPLTLTFTYASAGHPPPLVRGEDGTIAELAGSGPPLGLREPGGSLEMPRAITLSDRSLLVLYTDGLTESTRDILEGERRLHAALNDARVLESAEAAGAIRDVVLEQAHDDVAILTVRFDDVRRRVTSVGGEAGRAHWTFAASDAAAAREVRSAIVSVLRRHGAEDTDVRNAELLFSELVGNVVRHTAGTVEVAIDVSGVQPVLHVLDRGSGFTFHARLPNDVMSESGRGLYIASALASELSVLPRKDGGSHARAVLSFDTRTRPEPAG
jgi:PAS domain S-box-containing protein